ncbi:PadR family transcriptional regulator [Arhodomonas sp. AD133]|uniref:PadR family transcriptional regulator n=1 Tax=Arhodomonas sp. AD133 TaxID=3415009 RepID=UPI003EBAC15C
MDTRTICLGVLAGGEATGYEIRKCVSECFGYFLDISHGAIYPALASLHDEGLVECTEVRQNGRPDKKVYRLTEAGENALEAGLMRSPGRHRVRSEFIGLLHFASRLPPERLGALLDERDADFAAMLAYARSCGDDEHLHAGERFAAGLGEAMLTAGLDYLRRERPRLEREHTREYLQTKEEAAHER